MTSWVALDRMVEKLLAEDGAYGKQYTGKVLRSDAKPLTDADLLAKFHAFGIDLDRSSLETLCRKALSAQEIAQPLLHRRTFRGRREQMESDWIWICLSALWERWFPDEPCFELLDDKMQAGYQLQAPGEAAAACTIWLGAWNDALRIFDKSGMQSIREFDERFKGTEFVCNWVQDLEHALWSAGLKDRQFLTARVAVCEEVLRRFHAEDDSSIDNRLRALAESYFELGENAKAEGLYRDWLNVDPRWGRGWIGWSDCYRFTRTEFRNWDGTEQILREGLAVAGVRDRADLIGRLLDLCEEQRRTEEAAEFRREAKQMATEKSRSVSLAGTVLRQKTKIDFGGEGLPLSDLSAVTAMLRGNSAPAIAGKSKVGRNDPCPCGSGKKFKKCCGAWRTWACASAYPPPGPEKAPVPPLRVPIDSAGY